MRQTGIEVRRDVTATVLRKKARGEKDGRVASRLFGFANILQLEGSTLRYTLRKPFEVLQQVPQNPECRATADGSWHLFVNLVD